MDVYTVGLCSALLMTSAFLVGRFPCEHWADNWLAGFGYGFAQIVLFTIILSETTGLSRTGYGVLHGGGLLVSAGLWSFAARPPIIPKLFGDTPVRGWSLIAVLFVVGLAVVTIANFEFFRIMPSMNKDALSYHIPKAYFWLQQGNLHPLPTADFRWTEFPINSSVALTWMMAAGFGYEWLHLPQTLGVIVLAFAVFRLVESTGGTRRAAAIAALVCLGFPATIYQMGTSGNDLLTSSLAAGLASFVVAAYSPGARKPAIPRLALCSGIYAGLGMGTKLTFLLIGPGMALLAAGSCWVLGWEKWRYRTAAIGASIIVGFALLGSYAYVSNFVTHGSVYLSQPSKDRLARIDPALYHPGGNIALSIYQTLSWHGLQFRATDPLPTVQRHVGLWFDRFFGLGLAARPGISEGGYLTQPFRDENRAGYGLIGLVALLAAPFVAGLSGFRFCRRRRYEDLARLGLAITALSAFAAFCSTAPWGQTQARYLITFIPLMVAVLFATGSRSPRVVKLELAAAILAVWVAVFCVFLEPDRRYYAQQGAMGLKPIDLFLEGRWVHQIKFLRKVVPKGATIGVSTRIDSWAFAIPRELPDYRFVFLASADIGAALTSGRVQAVISELSPPPFPEALPLPGSILPPKQALHVRSLNSVLADSFSSFGLELGREAGALVMNALAVETFSFLNVSWPVAAKAIQFWLPDGLVRGPDKGISATIPFFANDTGVAVDHVSCNGERVPHQVQDGILEFSISPGTVRRDVAMQSCAVYLTESVPVELGEVAKSDASVFIGLPWQINVK